MNALIDAINELMLELRTLPIFDNLNKSNNNTNNNINNSIAIKIKVVNNNASATINNHLSAEL